MSLKKSGTHRALALAACETLSTVGSLRAALAELWELLGAAARAGEGPQEFWEAPYIDKLPINRTAAVMLIGSINYH